MPKAIFYVLALALFLFPPSSRASPILLQATSAHASDPAPFNGEFRALVFEGNDCASFQLHGNVGSLRGSVDQETLSPYIAGTSPTPATHGSEPIEAGPTNLTLTPGSACRILLTADEALATFATLQTDVGASTKPLHSYAPVASTQRQPTIIDPTNLLEIPLQQPSALLRGNLHLQVYDAEIRYEANGERKVVHTGETMEPYDGTVPEQAATKDVEREAFLELGGATITLGGHGQLYGRSAEIVMQKGALVLHGVKLPSGIADADIEAPLRTDLKSSNSAFDVEILEAQSASVNGVILVEPKNSGWLAPAFLVFVVAAILVAVGLALRADQREVAALLEQHQYEAILDMAPHTAWLPIGATSIRTAQAVAQLRLGLVTDAEKNLEGRRWRRTPLWHFLMAHLDTLRFQTGKAEEHLAESLAVAPGFQAEAEANPTLHALLPRALALAAARRQQLIDGA